MAIALKGNNPGGINDGTYCKAQPGYVGKNGRYAKFDELKNGFQAVVHLLGIYYSHGNKTVRTIINRWAPPEDSNDTSAYVEHVANACGVHPDQNIGAGLLMNVAKAICRQENGGFDAAWIAAYGKKL